ncbi:MAG: yceI [Mucilaginibacter sp.]|nr:yceI [Mucilaginibacter sp.]
MKNFKKQVTALSVIIAVIVFGLIPNELRAQAIYKLSAGKDVNINVLGSSNVHDWTMTSSAMESQGDFKFEGGSLRSLFSFSFSLDAKSLKSQHESMDNRTYKTIKADQYPKITYKLNSATVTQVQKNKYSIKTTGDLTIAGASQTIVMIITAIVNPDNTINCTGSEKLKLTDYKIDPPSFMLGAMKVKDDLTIQFNLVYKNSQLLSKAN